VTVVVGREKFLVAYNVEFEYAGYQHCEQDCEGPYGFPAAGLRYVKSMGVELKARNLAQVSINLTDYEQTPMHRVYEMVKTRGGAVRGGPGG